MPRPVLAGKAPAPADELTELFFASSAEERRLILLNLSYAALAPAEPIVPAIARESTHRLEAAALGHNSELFARELERVLRYFACTGAPAVRGRVGRANRGGGRALGMPTTVLQRILLCLNPTISQSVQRVYDLALLHQEIEPGAALKLIAIWQAVHPAEKPRPATPPPISRNTGRTKRASAARRPLVTRPKGCLGRVHPRAGGERPALRHDRIEKIAPARSSTSTIQMSESNLIWRAR